MKQNRLLGLGLSVSLLSTAFAACSDTESTGGDADASTSTGGSSAGGAAGSGTGGSGTGGRATGGTGGTGGAVNTGGSTGAGGAVSTGGTTGTGGSSDGGNAGGADGSTPGAGGADGGTPDGAAPAECGDTVDAGSECNTLVNSAGAVTLTAATGTLPTGLGGTLVDGLYHATRLVYYPGSSLTGNVLTSKQTVLFCGGTTQQVQSNNGQPDVHKSGTISFAGIVATFNNTCGTGLGIPWTSYTADNTMIALYSTSLGFEAVFTRQ